MKYNVYLYSVLDQRHNACTLIQVNLDTITEFELNVEGGCSLESGRLARDYSSDELFDSIHESNNINGSNAVYYNKDSGVIMGAVQL